MKFNVVIEEHIVQKFEIDADDMDSAMKIAEEKYKTGELVVENAELQTALMQVSCSESKDTTEWTEIY